MSSPSPHPSSPNRDQSIREYEAWKAGLTPLEPGRQCVYCRVRARAGHTTCNGHRALEAAA